MLKQPLTTIQDISFLKNITAFIVADKQMHLSSKLPFNVLDDLLNYHTFYGEFNRQDYCNPIVFLKALQINAQNPMLSHKEFRDFVCNSLYTINPKFLAK